MDRKTTVKDKEANAHQLPFADAPSIVRAHQKDSYFESNLRQKVQDTIQIFTGQRFIHTHPEELTVIAKFLYLALTTLIGSRTLGEEYTDLIYVSGNGRKIPKLLQRLGFILSYAVLPYFITKLFRRQFKTDEDDDKQDDGNSWRSKLSKLSYSTVMDSLINAHLAIFYFKGSYYQLSKRIFGLKYAFGHKVKSEDGVSSGGYELLGGVIFAQILFKSFNKLNNYLSSNSTQALDEKPKDKGILTQVPEPNDEDTIDLSNPKHLPYIPENSRKCMLCLSYMINPSCAPCGHLFCWACVSDWSREHPECPLCRQALTEQTLLPLR